MQDPSLRDFCYFNQSASQRAFTTAVIVKNIKGNPLNIKGIHSTWNKHTICNIFILTSYHT